MMNCLSVLSMFFGVLCSFGFEMEGEGSISSLTTYCTATSSCASTTISDDDISCRGFWSCWGSTLIPSEELTCPGFYSACYGIVAPSSSDKPVIYFSGTWSGRYGTTTASLSTVYCSGYLSCRNSVITSNNTHCTGQYSCSNSNITANSVLYSSGSNSLNNAMITDTPYISDGGYYTFNDALISSSGLSRLDIISRGEYSTSNSTVLCYSGSTCVIRCQGDESCDGMQLYCETGSTCRTTCYACASCPTEYNVSSIDDLLLTLKSKSGKLDIIDEEEESIKNKLLFINKEENNGIAEMDIMDIIDEKYGKYTFYAVISICITGMAIFFVMIQSYKKCVTMNKNQLDNSNQYKYQSI